jgi:peptidoglycan/LPS O-acetylase OafA/YrhL
LGFLLAAPSTLNRIFGSGSDWAVGESLGLAAAALTLTQAWLPFTALAWNVPAWSLSVEAFFYFLFPFVADRLSRNASRGRLVGWLGALWLLSLFPPGLYLLVTGAAPSTWRSAAPEAPNMWLATLMYFPLLRLPEFLFGTVLARLFLGRRVRVGAGIGVGALTAVLALLAFVPALPQPLLHNGLLVPAFGALILSLANGEGPLVAVLSSPMCRVLGEASYSLYLLHFHARPWILRGLKALVPDVSTSPTASFWAYLVCVIGCSVLVLRIFEIPARRKITAARSRRSSAAPLDGVDLRG